VPRKHGGITFLDNLALSCPGCNLAKAELTTGQDKSGRIAPLFNPRDYDPALLGWHLHFVLDRTSGLIVPRTSIAEATIACLRINDFRRIFARRIQILAQIIS
jgi:hypothetical protein